MKLLHVLKISKTQTQFINKNQSFLLKFKKARVYLFNNSLNTFLLKGYIGIRNVYNKKQTVANQ